MVEPRIERLDQELHSGILGDRGGRLQGGDHRAVLLAPRRVGARLVAAADAAIVGKHAESLRPEAPCYRGAFANAGEELTVRGRIDDRTPRLGREQGQLQPRLAERALDPGEILVAPEPELDGGEPGFGACPDPVLGNGMFGDEKTVETTG